MAKMLQQLPKTLYDRPLRNFQKDGGFIGIDLLSRSDRTVATLSMPPEACHILAEVENRQVTVGVTPSVSSVGAEWTTY